MSRKPRLPKKKNVRGICDWCHKKITASQGHYHPECFFEMRVVTSPRFARSVVYARDRGLCAHCGRHVREWDVDHIKPLFLSKGRLYFFKITNMQTLCKPCHLKKTRRDMTRYNR